MDELAEILWLAVHRGAQPAATGRVPSSDGNRPARPTQDRPVPPSPATDLDSSSQVRSEMWDVYVPPPLGRGATGVRALGTPLRAPGTAALPNALDLARALRPLAQRVPSRVRFEVDENATVQRIAEERIWSPVLRPAPARWLDLAVVIDQGSSMAIWGRTIAELRRMLEHHGAFRDVRSWSLLTDADDGVVRLYAGTALGNELREADASELLDSTGRRAILVVTDAVSPAWYTGSIAVVLETWRTNPVAMIHMLPEHFWSRTALSQATEVRLSAPARGAPNQTLIATRRRYSRRPLPAGLKLPTITLEPAPFAEWAQLLAGQASASTTGVIIHASASADPSDAGILLSESEETAERRVQQFRSTASPTALLLAGLLAAAPVVRLPVMRLIAQTMLDGVRQVHLAEVFLGGLLQQIVVERPVDRDEVDYEFYSGVREELLNTVVPTRAAEVFGIVSDFVGRHLGQVLDFPAVLANPSVVRGIQLSDEDRPFAQVAAMVLQRLGGRYAQAAAQVVQALPGSVRDPADLAGRRPIPGRRPSAPVFLSDTLSATRQPLPEGPVKLYVCGVTPYDTTHLGHAFTFVQFDTLVRALRWLGYDVIYVQSIADIDDSILMRARKLGVDWQTLGDEQTEQYRADMRDLNVADPTHLVRATSAIPTMLHIIDSLIASEAAYVVDGGSVFFRVRSTPTFGELSKLSRDEMLSIALQQDDPDVDDPRKEDPLDFVLWKGWSHRPDEPAWDSPWGPGRPGWHLECSGVCNQYLGSQLTIYGGGGDLVFPHHESEMAQSEKSFGERPFARIWTHVAMVRMDGEKMSKSLGNMVFVRDLLRTYSADAIRLYLLGHHYRKVWEWAPADIDSAAGIALRLAEAVRQPDLNNNGAADREAFAAALQDDLNTPRAIEILQTLRGGTLQELGDVLGLTFEPFE